MKAPLRIAMWSGPRNISTAMMRAWENRGDCTVTDEPLYAAFLATTGIDHPARDVSAGQAADNHKARAIKFRQLLCRKPIARSAGQAERAAAGTSHL